MKINFKVVLLSLFSFYAGATFAVDGVSCVEEGIAYDMCKTGTISKLTYRKLDKAVLVSGIDAPGCGTGWILQDLDTDENSKAVYSSLLAAHLSLREITLTRVGHGSCVKWDGDWKGVITEISLN